METEDPKLEIAATQAGSGPREIRIWTVGHSTRPIGEFIALLGAHHIQQLVDVRTIPRSRHNPQFNQDLLPDSLEKAGIQYRHMPALGGLRHARPDSINTAWRNASFRGYADYMQTPRFNDALDELIRLASNGRTAIMCAEAVPWRCHRSLIADALLVHGVKVDEISGATSVRAHTLTPWSRVEGRSITYPAESLIDDESASQRRGPSRDEKTSGEMMVSRFRGEGEVSHPSRQLRTKDEATLRGK